MAKNAAVTYERTLVDIRKVFEQMNVGHETPDAHLIIEKEEKLGLIDAKLEQLKKEIM